MAACISASSVAFHQGLHKLAPAVALKLGGPSQWSATGAGPRSRPPRNKRLSRGASAAPWPAAALRHSINQYQRDQASPTALARAPVQRRRRRQAGGAPAHVVPSSPRLSRRLPSFGYAGCVSDIEISITPLTVAAAGMQERQRLAGGGPRSHERRQTPVYLNVYDLLQQVKRLAAGVVKL